MAVYFFDSSAIVKRYVSETGTAWVSGITAPAAGNRIYVAAVTGVEVISALTRRQRSGHFPAVDAVAAIARFRLDFASEYRIVEITPTLIGRAMTLAETHALRGYDAVQMSAALETHVQRLALRMSPLTVVSADAHLNDAAREEGLTVDDPNLHP